MLSQSAQFGQMISVLAASVTGQLTTAQVQTILPVSRNVTRF
jgi:hypothetical protein